MYPMVPLMDVIRAASGSVVASSQPLLRFMLMQPSVFTAVPCSADDLRPLS
jgi:hypothetical protein